MKIAFQIIFALPIAAAFFFLLIAMQMEERSILIGDGNGRTAARVIAIVSGASLLLFGGIEAVIHFYF